ncbi:MAG: glycosyltransferase family 4 protein [Microthrixaceae bacterium]
MITKFLPLPADSGGKQRSLALLERLTGVGDVTLCAFDDGTADHDGLRQLGVKVRTAPRPGAVDTLIGIARRRSITAARFASRALLHEINDEARVPPDCLIVVYSQLAPYARSIEARHKVLDLQNIESALLASYATARTGPSSIPAWAEGRAVRRIERTALGEYDTVTVVSETDRKRLPGTHPRVLICPNGWQPGPPLPPSTEPVVAFVGLLGWAPNADAAVWLAEEVWPHVRRAMPEARLVLVGREPTAAVRALARHDVAVTGTVPEVTPFLARARVAVAPLRAGGGSRLKILEALDAGRPVVATTIGAEGLESLVGRGILLADGAASFAETVVDLLRDPGRAASLGRQGNHAVAERFSWDRTLAPLLDDVREHGQV